MKYSKKIFYIFICFLTILTLTNFKNVKAAQTITITHQTSNAKKGEIVEVVVKLNNCPNIKSLGIEPIYDSEKLEYISGEWLIRDALLSDFNQEEQNGVILYSYSKDLNGPIASYKFKIKEENLWEDIIITSNVKINGLDDEYILNIEEGKIEILCDHIFGEKVRLNNPTCTEEGKLVSTCTICQKKVYEIEPPLGHDFDEVEKINSTCTTNGYSYHICKICGTKEVIEEYEKEEHLLSDWIIDNNIRYKECLKCGQILQKESIQGENSQPLSSFWVALIAVSSLIVLEIIVFLIIFIIKKKKHKY